MVIENENHERPKIWAMAVGESTTSPVARDVVLGPGVSERDLLQALEDAFMVGIGLQVPTSAVEEVNVRTAARGRGMCDAVRNIASRLGIELGVPV